MKTDNFHVPLLCSNEMYVMLELLTFDDILDYCLIKFINWCFTERFDMFHTYFVPLIPQHAHQVRSPKLNYPKRLEVHWQSDRVPYFNVYAFLTACAICFVSKKSSYQLIKIFKLHILRGYRTGWMLISFSPSLMVISGERWMDNRYRLGC